MMSAKMTIPVLFKIKIIWNKSYYVIYSVYDTTKKFATNFFNARLALANLITKTDLDAKLSSRKRNITQNKTKNSPVEKELNKLKLFILVILLEKVILKNMAHKII